MQNELASSIVRFDKAFVFERNDIIRMDLNHIYQKSQPIANYECDIIEFISLSFNVM